jgi:acyl carrier protein
VENARVSVAEEISTLLAKNFGVDSLAVQPDIQLRGLGMDSLALEELRVLIEERMRIDLEDVHLTSRDTVAELVMLVHEKTVA